MNFFKKKPTYTFTGALLDTRSKEDKDKDYKFKEIVAFASPVIWVEKNEWRSFPVLNQQQQGSCVAHTMAKIMGIKYFLQYGLYLDFSRADIYRRRANKPQGGMIGDDAFQIAQKGVTLESLVSSGQITDKEVDSLVVEPFKEDIGAVLKINSYVTLPIKDFETVASTIQATGKGVMVWLWFNVSEWSQKFPKVIDIGLNINDGLRHSVTATDFGLIDGKKYIKIEDSAHFGGLTERWISEEFFNMRNFYSAYLVNFKFEVAEDKPSYKEGDIISLQDCLKAEGLFPINQDSTGYFGVITKKAVIAFQIKYGLNPPLGNVGPLTTAKLLSLYP